MVFNIITIYLSRRMKMAGRTVSEVEKEMKIIYPEKELAYMDYTENAGSSSHRDRFWNNYKCLQRKWNSLVRERYTVLNPSDQGDKG